MRRELLLCALSLVLAGAVYLQVDPASPFAVVSPPKDPDPHSTETTRQHAVEELDYALAHEKMSAEERVQVLQMRAEYE